MIEDIDNFDILLDNGILKNISHILRPSLESNFLASIFKHWKMTQTWNPHFLATPIMLMEALPIAHSSIDVTALGSQSREALRTLLVDTDKANHNEKLKIALDMIEERLRSNPVLEIELLKKRTVAESNFRQPFGKDFYLKVFLPNLQSKRAYESMITSLAMSMVQYRSFLDLLPPEAKEIHIETIYQSLLRSQTEGIGNFVATRGLDEALFEEVTTKKSSLEQPYKDKDQRVDTEIAHFVTFGNLRKDHHRPVIVFTQENCSNWHARLKRYADATKKANQKFEKYFGELTPKPGFIINVNGMGSITTPFLDVSSISS